MLAVAAHRSLKLTMPTIIMRGEYDGIASFDDLIEFFKKLPNSDKQFVVMRGISHASFSRRTTRWSIKSC